MKATLKRIVSHFFSLYKSRTQQTAVDEDTLVVVSQPVLCVVFLGSFFFPLSQVMTGTIWTDFWSTISVFFCVQKCLRETLRTGKRSATHSVHSSVSVLCKQSCTESSNSKIDSGSFRQDLLVLLIKFDNSLTY